ncbi:MAG: DMT family transporter [Pseudomonadota bacterium]
MIKNTKSFAPYLMLIIGAIMISFSSVFVKLANVAPTAAGFYRMFFGGLVLFLIVIIKSEKFFYNFRHLFYVILCAAIFALDLIIWHRSIHYVGPGLSTLLAAFQVFFMAGIGLIVYKEKITFKLIIAIPLALFGLYLILGDNWTGRGDIYRLGVIFGLLTGLTYAAYVVFLRKSQNISKEISGHSNLASITIICAIILGITAFIQNESFIIPDFTSLSTMLAYGIISQVLGWILISIGILKVPTPIIGLILLLQPTLAFVWDILFFNRPTKYFEVLGALLALLAIYLGSQGNKRTRRGHPELVSGSLELN